MSQSPEPKSISLEDYRWQNRLVLLFAPSADHADFKVQSEELSSFEEEVDDRDLIVFRVFEATGFLGEDALSEKDIQALRQRFEVPPQRFLFILIGKDGGVKRRSEDVVVAADLFAQIDSMPMRQREMRSDD